MDTEHIEDCDGDECAGCILCDEYDFELTVENEQGYFGHMRLMFFTHDEAWAEYHAAVDEAPAKGSQYVSLSYFKGKELASWVP